MQTLEFIARDYRGQNQSVVIKGKLIHQEGAVSLIKVRKRSYVVVYGLQVSRVLDYRLAAIEYGNCKFHELSCEGKLD